MRYRTSRAGSGSRGFTLVELMTVFAILSALVALLMPALQSALASARQASCTTNLKQWGMITSMYMDDNRGYLWPQSQSLDPDNDGDYDWFPWNHYVSPVRVEYLEDVASSIWYVGGSINGCPNQSDDPAFSSGPLTFKYFSYAVNYELCNEGSPPLGNWQADPGPDNYIHSLQRSKIGKARKVSWITDVKYEGLYYGYPASNTYITPGLSTCRVGYHHQGQCNRLYVDGSVDTTPLMEVADMTP